MVKKFEDTFSGVDRIAACDGRTEDGRTSCDGIVRAMHMRRAVKITCCIYTKMISLVIKARYIRKGKRLLTGYHSLVGNNGRSMITEICQEPNELILIANVRV